MPKAVTKPMETHGISIESIIKMLEEGTAPMVLLEFEENIESKNTRGIDTEIKISLE